MAAALIVMAVWSSSSCSAPPVTRAVSEQVHTCFGAAPQAWTNALDSHAVLLPSGVTFGLSALVGDTGFGQYNSATGDGLGEVDLATGHLTVIASFPQGAGGVGAVAVDYPWVVWEQLDSATNLSDWSVHAWNRSTGENRTLTTSRLADGSYVRGQQPLPVVSGGVAAWAQPVPTTRGTASAELRVVELNTGRARTPASGRISSPVYAGRYLTWGRLDDSGAFTFQALDSSTMRPVALPERLRHPGSIGYLAGSSQYLAWSNQDYTGLTLWRIGSAEYHTFTQDGRHQFQFLGLAGHYLLWYDGISSSVLDLTTGGGFDVPGTVTGSPAWIVTSEPVDEANTGGGPITSRLSRLATSSAPTITNCA